MRRLQSVEAAGALKTVRLWRENGLWSGEAAEAEETVENGIQLSERPTEMTR